MKSIRIYALHTLLGIISGTLLSKVEAQGINLGSSLPPHPSAAVEISSNQSGFLPPRLSQAARDAIVQPAPGLIIYNTDSDCMESYFPMSGWKTLQCDCQAFPNAVFSIPPAAIGIAATFTSAANNMTYLWNFAQGSPSTSSNQSESIIWNTAGTYAVSLTLTDSAGCVNSYTDSVIVSNCPPGFNQPQTFSFTGAAQTYTVPACVSGIRIECWGASGGGPQTGGNQQAGRGGYTSGILAVTPGEVLHIYVGGQGQYQSNVGSNPTALGGWNGGGNSGACLASSQPAAGGGGTDVRFGGTGLQNRIMVAGGGGGCYANYDNTRTGGAGGGLSGGNCPNGSSQCGGGTQTAGGSGGTQHGSIGQGGHDGNGSHDCGGGGGGGYYGGGANSHGAGGGGSAYISGHTGCIPATHSSGKVFSNTQMQSGVHHGNGVVIITPQ